ncbi:fimbria/pilus outer membrane usher protein [Luteimonas aquatica]|uniref:fimbria/pilus outer membrane usher protein n=1 Tax=Luteimonas aquatica TaxID=450364 RepID=UPI003CE4EF60
MAAAADADVGARPLTDVTLDPARPLADPDGDEDLYLQVTLNRTDTGRLAHFMRSRDSLRASVATLREIGFALPGRQPAELVALDSLPGLSVRYDAALQRVHLDAPLSLLSLDTTLLNRPDGMSSSPAGASPGALFNYDLYASQERGASNLAATAELRLFGVGAGVFSTSALTRTYREKGEGWRGETVRLDSSWQLSFPDSAVTLTLGDSYSGFLDWTRTVRLGGIQIGRNFSLQPYRITTPLPAFLGEAAVPSAVDLYVNGIRQYSGEVPPGPFQLATVPGISGVGNAQIVVTDAFGRTRSIDFPFYATQQLLAKGLSDWSLALGVVREDYGIRSFSYGNDPVASGNLRYGISDDFTFEAHAEGGGGLASAGLGGLWLLGRAGVASASYARSSLDGLQGGQTSLGYSWNNNRFNLSLQSQRTHGDYRDIASLYGVPPAEISERALAGVNLSRLGNFSASYLRLRYPDQEDTRYAGVFWTQTFDRGWAANLSYNQNLDDHDDRTLYLGVSIALGDERQASVSFQRNGRRDNAVLDVSKPVPGDGDIDRGYGWRLQARGGDDGEGGLAEVGWISPVGRYGAGVASFDGHAYGYASASGSLVWMGGHAFAARSITDAFAVVSTDGIAGVPVKLENRLVGRTDADGMLLVTPLQAWQDNKLSIDPLDLPANLRIDRVDVLAAPRDRSGVGVRFGLTPVRAAVLVLRDASGAPLPLGSRVHAPGSAEPAVVGYDGETYLDALQPHNRLRIDFPEGGGCAVDFDYPSGQPSIPRIGPLQCAKEPSP